MHSCLNDVHCSCTNILYLCSVSFLHWYFSSFWKFVGAIGLEKLSSENTSHALFVFTHQHPKENPSDSVSRFRFFFCSMFHAFYQFEVDTTVNNSYFVASDLHEIIYVEMCRTTITKETKHIWQSIAWVRCSDVLVQTHKDTHTDTHAHTHTHTQTQTHTHTHKCKCAGDTNYFLYEVDAS